MHAHDPATLTGPIYNAGWWVRHYHRPHQRAERARALHELGLACRAAFNATDDFAPILRAMVDTLSPRAPDF